MAKNKMVKSNHVITFEKDEKKSIIIALVVSAVVVLATVLAIIAIRHKGLGIPIGTTTTEEVVDSYTVTDNYTDDGSIIVTNQEELDTKLEASTTDESIGAITIQTEEEQSIEIPEGDYTNVALNIDAPYTEVSNYANFNTINIKQISANTWVEHASGNNLVLSATASHVIVESEATVESISNIAYGSTLAVEIYGTVKAMSLEADDSISSVSVEGTLEGLDMYSKTNLSLSGVGAQKLNVNLQAGATGSVVKSSVPLNMQLYGSAELYMEAGAEESTLAVLNGDLVTNVHNNTAMALEVTDPEGSAVTIDQGADKSFGEEKAAQTNTNTEQSAVSSGSATGSTGSTGSSGRSSSSSSSSSNRSSSSSSTSSSTTTSQSTATQQNTQQTTTQQTTQQTTQTTQNTSNKNNTSSSSSNSSSSYEKKAKELEQKVSSQNSTISTLNSSIEELKKAIQKLTDKNAEYEEELEQTRTELDEAYERILEAQKTSIIDFELPNSAYKELASEDGKLVNRIDNPYLNIVDRMPSANELNAEYIEIQNSPDAPKAYLVKLYFYYFIDVAEGEPEKLECNWMDTDKSMVLRPGDSWVFARQKFTGADNPKYVIEVVATDLGEDGPRKFEVDINDIGILKFTEFETHVRESNVTDIQAIFFDVDGRVLGDINYSTRMDETMAETDLPGVDRETAVVIINNVVNFTKPEGAVDWNVFVN